MMKIIVNHSPIEIATNTSLKTLLNQLNFASTNGIAVAINNKVLPKSNWEDYALAENDSLTIIRATQGG